MAVETGRHVWWDRGLVHLLLRWTGARHPRVGEVRLRVTQRVVAHTVELGLLTIIDGHCHGESNMQAGL